MQRWMLQYKHGSKYAVKSEYNLATSGDIYFRFNLLLQIIFTFITINNLDEYISMIHGSCMIVISRLRGESPYPPSTAVAEVTWNLPAIPEKVLPHFLLVGLLPVRVDRVHGRTVSPPQEPVAQLQSTRSVSLSSAVDRNSSSFSL